MEEKLFIKALKKRRWRIIRTGKEYTAVKSSNLYAHIRYVRSGIVVQRIIVLNEYGRMYRSDFLKALETLEFESDIFAFYTEESGDIRMEFAFYDDQTWYGEVIKNMESDLRLVFENEELKFFLTDVLVLDPG